MKRLICFLIGHEIDQMAYWDSECPRDCLRCGRQFRDPNVRVREDVGFWIFWWKLQARFSLAYWRKCPDCGRRRHRHHVDCIPF